MENPFQEFCIQVSNILDQGSKKYGTQYLSSDQKEFITEKLRRISSSTTKHKKTEDWAKIAAYAYLGWLRTTQNNGVVAVCSYTGETAQTLHSEGLVDTVVHTRLFNTQQDLWGSVLSLAPRVVMLLGCSVIVPESVLTALNNNIYNLHPGTLPGLEGKDPHIKALQQQRRVTHATIHRVTKEIDSGEVLLQMAVPITKNDTPETLLQKLRTAGVKITRLFLQEGLWQS